MKSSNSLLTLRTRACAASLLLAWTAFAQEATLESLIEGSRVAMAEEDWGRALDFNTRAIADFGGGEPLQQYGAGFGVIFYRKGLCEMKLKRWKEAMQSFETCYRDFPNNSTLKEGGNIYQKLALLKWGESAMGAGEWAGALALFDKFGAERDKKRDTYPLGSYYISRAVCLYQLGRIAEGSENLEIAIRNKDQFPTPELGIVAGFQELVGAAIGKRDEQALLDFIAKNRGELLITPYEISRFSPVFLKLAGDAIGAGMQRAAMEIYQFVPSTDVVIDDVRARLRSLGAAARIESGGAMCHRAKLEEDLANLEADRRGKRAAETIKLAAVAFLHEASGNLTGAYAAYRQLEMFCSGAEKREENLSNLIRVASRIGLETEVQKYGEIFTKDFPQSPKIGEVRRLVLGSLYAEGDSARCVEVAGPLLDLLAKGTPEHDLCLFILGASYFNQGVHDRAKVLLDLHAKEYPASMHVAEVAYFQASNAAKLGNWEVAGTLFDTFLTIYRDNPLAASALYERAACHFARNEADAVKAAIQRLISEFPTSPLCAPAWNLLGSVEQVLGRPDEAGNAYLKALKIASSLDNRQVAGESLCNLVEWASANAGKDGANKRMTEAVAHADLFWKEYAEDSPYRARVAVAQVRPLIKAGRGEEVLGRLREILTASLGNPAEHGILVDAYAEAYLAKHGPEELAGEFANFPGIDPANRSLLARLRMAVINAFESRARELTDEEPKQAAVAMVKSLYQKLKTDFKPAELDAATLLRLGDHLRLHTSTPREALICYDEVIARDDAAKAGAALLGRADVRARSTVVAEMDQGIVDFVNVRESSKVAGERAYASFRIIEVLMAKGDFAKVIEEAAHYQEIVMPEDVGLAPQVELMLARAYQELKRTDEAIAGYARVWSTNTDDPEISAPAMIGWMRLLWLRNREETSPTDRQTAYEGGVKYLARTRDFAAGLKEEDRAPWREIEEAVRTFATSPSIKPLAGSGEESNQTPPP